MLVRIILFINNGYIWIQQGILCYIVEVTFKRITQLECNNLNNAQYNRRETLEINPVPSDIADDVLEQSVCQALSQTGISVRTG